MSPEQFLQQVSKGKIAPVYLFVGQEAYRREQCRKALIEAMLPEDEREQGLIRLDMDEVSLPEVIDDASSYSLFAPRRVIWVLSAESALPRGRAAAVDDDGEGGKPAGAEALERYAKSPTEGVVLVFQASRWDIKGEDKARVDRLKKYFGAVTAQVEFLDFTPAEARQFAQTFAKNAGLKFAGDALDFLVEAVGGNVQRLATELDKLKLFRSGGGAITEEDITSLVPDARATSIFALVSALGRKDRMEAMQILDTLVRDGEYLPLALGFLATQFRFALVAREAGLKGSQQVQSHFSRMGTPMWPQRAEQVWQTASAFSKPRLERGIELLFKADCGLRDIRPDDRIVMERLILQLTS